MTSITSVAGMIAGFLSLIAFLPYIRAIIKRETRPNRATWWIWSGVGVMLATSYYSSGASHTIWVPVSYVIGPFTIALLSIKYGEVESGKKGGWSRFDKFCVIGAGFSLVLWLLFSNPLIAYCINLFIDFLGALPTIRKVYREPETEDRLSWALFIAGNTANLFAVEQWTFSIAAYPIWMLLGSGTITLLVFRPRRKKPQEEERPIAF